MIARTLNDVPDCIIFASGESNSSCVSQQRFEREKLLLKSVIDGRKVVYFSTVTVTQENKTPYIFHKINMESLVREGPHLILRMSNIVGRDQSPAQLIPSLTRQVLSGIVKVEDSVRDIMDVEDLRDITHQMLQNGDSGTHNVLSGNYVKIESLVSCICHIFGADPEVKKVTASEYPIVNSPLRFDLQYYRRVLEKYCPLF